MTRRCRWRCRACHRSGWSDPAKVGTPRWGFWIHYRAHHLPSSIWDGTR